MLQNLVSRREQLAEREGQLDLRENLLQVAQQRVEEKINELKIVEAHRDKLQAEFDQLWVGKTPLVPLEVHLDGPAMKTVQLYARKTGDVGALESDLIVYIVDTTE